MEDGVITITYTAVPNLREEAGGFLPMVWVNGRAERSRWSARGYEQEEALEMARIEAQAEAARFAGDWTITIEAQ